MGLCEKCIFIKSGCLLFYSVISNECVVELHCILFSIPQLKSSLEKLYSKLWLFIFAKHSYIQKYLLIATKRTGWLKLSNAAFV